MAAAKKKTEEVKMIKVTLVKSTIACLKNQKANVEALGLHKWAAPTLSATTRWSGV